MHAKQGFTDQQVQILTDWIHSRNKPSEHLNLPLSSTGGIDIDAVLQAQGIDTETEAVSGLDVVVARILLRDITYKLPQWAVGYENGEIQFGRDNEWRKDVLRPLGIIPSELFEINWADSGPGFSWPEAYHACPVPGFDITVVTASVDSTDAHGYTEFALGWFNAGDEVAVESGKIIRDWWSFQYNSWDQCSWAYLFSDGVIAEDEALSWRGTVWTENTDED